jgi:hypothetical protein
MFFQQRRQLYDKECIYHAYCNYIQRVFPIITFSKSNDHTLKSFYEFLWKQTHPFLFMERAIFLATIEAVKTQRIPPTNYFICKNQHIYTALFRGCRYVILDSNEEEPRYVSSVKLATELCDVEYVFMELTVANHEDILNKVRDVSQKNEYYRQRCESIVTTIEMYKSISKN